MSRAAPRERRRIPYQVGSVLVLAMIGVPIASGCGGNSAESHSQAGRFGTGGKVLTAMPESDGADAIAIEGNGRIVAVGAPLELARYTPDGRLDPSFGSAGKVGGGWRRFLSSALPLQQDGKIVVGGHVPRYVAGNDDWGDLALARYSSKGQVDQSFGEGGRVRAHFGPRDFPSSVAALAIQRDDKILVAGSTLARYTSNGRLDRSFGSEGKVQEVLNGGRVHFSALAIQPDGKIVGAGEWHKSAALHW